MSPKYFVKAFVKAYGLTQTTAPYTGAVTFRRTAGVLDLVGPDWSAPRRQPAKLEAWRFGPAQWVSLERE